MLVTLDPGGPAGANVVPWAGLIADPHPAPDDVAEAAARIPASALACIIYTSGTGGAPKGVMLPHRAILANCRGAFDLLRTLRLRRETYLSFLPLSHSYEHTAGQFFLLSIGTEIAYARGVEHLAADMLTVRPTIMTMVPRVLDVIRARIIAQVHRQPAWRRALFERAVALGIRRSEGERLGPAERAAGRGTGAAGAPSRAGPLRRAVPRGDVGRRAAGAGGGAVLSRPRHRADAGLRADRGRPGDLGQHAARDADRHGGPAARRGRSAPGARWRDSGARRPGDGRLLGAAGRHRGGDP